MSVGASEQMEDLEMKIEQLEKENTDLKVRLRKVGPAADGGQVGDAEP